jgi:chromosome segregation ATPase
VTGVQTCALPIYPYVSIQDNEFVLGADSEENIRYEPSVQVQRYEKLNLKITLIAVLIPTIIGIFVGFAYLDMKEKVAMVRNSGSTEIQKTSSDLLNDISDVKNESQAYSSKTDKSITDFNNRLDKAGKDIAYLSSDKIDSKTFKSEIEKYTAQIGKLSSQLDKATGQSESLKKEIDSLSAQNTKLVSMIQELQKKHAEIQTLKSSVDAMKTDVGKLKTSMIDKDDLATELKKQKVFYQMEIQESAAKLDKKIQALKSDEAAHRPKTDIAATKPDNEPKTSKP